MRQLTNCTFLQVTDVGFCEMHLCLMLTKHYSNTVGFSIEEVRHACTNHYEWSALASWAWPTVLMGGQETCLYIGFVLQRLHFYDDIHGSNIERLLNDAYNNTTVQSLSPAAIRQNSHAKLCIGHHFL